MSVHFYVQNKDFTTTANKEMWAVYRMARELIKIAGTTDMILIFNIDPETSSRLKNSRLTQLDAVLLTPTLICNLELKHCYEEIRWSKVEGRCLKASGMPLVPKGRRNPYQQVRNAREKWEPYLTAATKQFSSGWQPRIRQYFQGMHACTLLHPYLHPQSRTPKFESADRWYYFGDIADINMQAARAILPVDKALPLSVLIDIAKKCFDAQRWTTLEASLKQPIGQLIIKEPGNINNDKRLIHSYEEFLVGREARNAPHLTLENPNASRTHLRIEVLQNKALRAYDMGSKNKSYLNEETVAEEGKLMLDGETLYVGSVDVEKATHITLKLTDKFSIAPENTATA